MDVGEGTTEVGSDGVRVRAHPTEWGGLIWRKEEDGVLHRADGKPAIIEPTGTKSYIENGSLVCGDRPHCVRSDGAVIYESEDGSSYAFGPKGELQGFQTMELIGTKVVMLRGEAQLIEWM